MLLVWEVQLRYVRLFRLFSWSVFSVWFIILLLIKVEGLHSRVHKVLGGKLMSTVCVDICVPVAVHVPVTAFECQMSDLQRAITDCVYFILFSRKKVKAIKQ